MHKAAGVPALRAGPTTSTTLGRTSGLQPIPRQLQLSARAIRSNQDAATSQVAAPWHPSRRQAVLGAVAGARPLLPPPAAFLPPAARCFPRDPLTWWWWGRP